MNKVKAEAGSQRKLFSCLLAPCHRALLLCLSGPLSGQSPHPSSEAAARRRCPSALTPEPQNAREGCDDLSLSGWGEGVGGGRAPAGQCWACSWPVSEAQGGAEGGKGAEGGGSGAVASHQAEDCSRHAQAPRRFCVREFCRRRDPCEGVGLRAGSGQE